jgi:hypothetical protein
MGYAVDTSNECLRHPRVRNRARGIDCTIAARTGMLQPQQCQTFSDIGTEMQEEHLQLASVESMSIPKASLGEPPPS